MNKPHRSILENELHQLNENILRLSSRVEEAIEKSVEALLQRNLKVAHTVMMQDKEINALRYEIEEECLRILATQHPAATDLRTVIAAIHLAVELERMGDYAVGIATLIERMENDPAIDSFHQLPKMCKKAIEMTKMGIDSYIHHDAVLAKKLISQDDKLDKYYQKLFLETLQEMKGDNTYIRRATFLLWAGHNLERIGDRATNIAERALFMITGQLHYD